jgi:hypothetical protein
MRIQSDGARMDNDERNRSREIKAEMLRLCEECRNLLEVTESLARRLEELTGRLSNDQADHQKPAK